MTPPTFCPITPYIHSFLYTFSLQHFVDFTAVYFTFVFKHLRPLHANMSINPAGIDQKLLKVAEK